MKIAFILFRKRHAVKTRMTWLSSITLRSSGTVSRLVGVIYVVELEYGVIGIEVVCRVPYMKDIF